MKKVLFIGQAMPRLKKDSHDWPTLNKWLFEIGLTLDDIRSNFVYSALVNYFPGSNKGGHLVPTENEILKEQPRLKKLLNNFNPDIIVTVGKLSAVKCLQKDINLLSEIIGKKFILNPYGLMSEEKLIIPLPHPSGASTWRYNTENKKLLNEALYLIKISLLS